MGLCSFVEVCFFPLYSFFFCFFFPLYIILMFLNLLYFFYIYSSICLSYCSCTYSYCHSCSHCAQIALISHTSKVMLKILQARIQQYVNREIPDVQASFRKGPEEPEMKLPTSTRSLKKQEFQKNIYFCFINCTKAFVWITTNSGKFFKRWEYQTTWPASWEICIQVKKQQLELDMEHK